MALPPGPSGLPARSCVLVVLDGWGIAPAGPGNAISLAATPVFDELWSTYPHAQLIACGRAVGLPEGQMGNSEVGHMNLGAGAVVMQDLTRIDEAAASGEFATNPVLREAFSRSERVHLIGLVSDGGVHSGWAHLEALIRLGASLEVPDLVLHAFTDGRDTLPHSGAGYLETVQGWMEEAGAGRSGRWWAGTGRWIAISRWDRTQKAYDLLVHGRAEHRASTGVEAVARGLRARRDRRVHHPGGGRRLRGLHPARRLGVRVQLPSRPDAADLARAGRSGGSPRSIAADAPPVERYATMTQYEEDFDYPVAFPPRAPVVTLPRVLAERGVRQLHVAETEKYAHVTYFFSCGEEEPFAGERRELVSIPARRAHLRPQARDERARGGRRVRRAPGARTSPRSGSSTSPTPTWSATPA